MDGNRGHEEILGGPAAGYLDKLPEFNPSKPLIRVNDLCMLAP